MKHFISSLSVLCANTPPCEGRVSSRKILSLLLILFLSIGNAWGAEATLSSISTKNVVTTKGQSVSTTFDDVTCQVTRNSGNQPGFYTSSGIVRYYSEDVMTLSVPSGNTITKVVFTMNSGNVGTVDVGTVSSNTWTGNAESISFTGTATVKITKIVVTYEATSGGSTAPSLSANPTEIDFGTVYQDATVEDKTVAVNFANLTGSVSYSGLSTPFTATGTISNNGDKITIAANTSTIGEYSQTLTIASAADSKTAEVTVKMNVVEKPAPTGTFTLYTGDLIEGDYVIVSTNSLKAEVNSDRLASLPVTISNDEIVDPDATTIWHIAKSGEYWTLYNANKAKYAASTGAKNKAALLDDATDDKALWSVTGTSTYEFVNKKNTANSVNANLRYNSGNAENSRWACYSTSTGAALSLYRKAGTKYNVTVSSTTNGSVTANPTSAEAGTIVALTVTPDAGYVLDALTVTDASSNTIEVADDKFTMPAADVTISATFKENEKPAATLTLSKNGVEETFPGSWKQDDVVTLPSITSECVKEFVGWSANPTCNVAPEYEAGDEYALAATTQTLYAVYATAGAGETLTITPSAVSGSADPYTFTIDAAGYSLTAKKNSGSSAPTINASAKDVRIYAKGTVTLIAPKAMGTIVFNLSTQGKQRLAPITASVGTIAPQASGDATVTWTGDATEVTFTVGDKADFGSDGSSKGGQLCFSTIEVTHSSEYSNYSTTCAAALEKPILSVAEGTYPEAKSIELTATEGTIYYTLDGTEPTESSTPYTAAIDLDECGTTTIKAIAISGESKSPIASATYTINLPITNTAATAYTPAEAIAIIDGACDKSEEVYVKGVVVSTSEFNETYGNYDVIVKAVDDNSATPTTFTFYRMYKAAGETTFTASDEVIGVGDIITAKGKLTKYNTTYELAEGCYMVERVAFTEPKTDISNTEATAYTVDKAFELISDIKSDLDKEVYVKGFVAVASTQLYNEKYLTYSISDNGQTTGNVLKVYDGLDIGGEAFASKDDVKAGDYVVVKGKLLNYGGTYEINKDNQLVQHVKAATITIADITMEVGETKTIAATVDPAGAEVTYTIKENAANAISLSGNVITANVVGTATIKATIAEKADEYKGATKEFTVTVKPQNIAILPFTFNGGKADIENTSGMTQEGLGTDYSSAPNSQLKFDHTGDWVVIHFDSEPGELSYNIKNNSFSGGTFSVQESADGETYTDVKVHTEITGTQNEEHTLLSTSRYIKFIYTTKSSGNVGLGNIKITKLSVLRADLYDGKWGTLCPDQKVTYMQGASFYTLTYLEMKDGMPYKLFFDEITTDYLEAGKPYLFIAEGEKIKGVKSGEVVSIASNYNGFYGNVSGNTISLTTDQTEYVADGDVVNNYGVINSRFTLLGNGTNVAHERAHVQIKNGQLDCPNPPASLPALAPGARRVVAGATGINTATGVDQVQGDNVPTKMIINGQLFILRGEKMYDAQGKLVK